eukprot:9393297-Lingulodinium_polyedra.AAC.1
MLGAAADRSSKEARQQRAARLDCQAGAPLWQRSRQVAKARMRCELQATGEGGLHGGGDDEQRGQMDVFH